MRIIGILILLISFFSLSVVTVGQESNFPPGTKLAPAKKVVLILSEKEYTEIDYPPRPCVYNELVNMIPSEKILVEAEVKEGKLVNLKHVDKNEHPELTIGLAFTQNQDRKNPFMMLAFENPFDKDLKYEAGIQFHGEQGFKQTSTVLVPAKQGSYEAWPDPLTRIILRNFELIDNK